MGSVGEPINPEAWMWYHEHIGGGNCPIVDTWWQTETGGIMIAPLPGATVTKPGSATRPLPGVGAELVDELGQLVTKGGGYLTLTKPWPGMLRGIWVTKSVIEKRIGVASAIDTLLATEQSSTMMDICGYWVELMM